MNTSFQTIHSEFRFQDGFLQLASKSVKVFNSERFGSRYNTLLRNYWTMLLFHLFELVLETTLHRNTLQRLNRSQSIRLGTCWNRDKAVVLKKYMCHMPGSNFSNSLSLPSLTFLRVISKLQSNEAQPSRKNLMMVRLAVQIWTWAYDTPVFKKHIINRRL